MPPANQPEATPLAAPRTAVVIVSYNRTALLRRCLESLERAEARGSFEVIVVDNGSTDGSPQVESDFPAIRFIRLPKNFGLTKALNIGIRATDMEYILLLHDDTEVEPPAVRLLTETLEARSDAAAVCPLLTGPSGEPAPQIGQLPPDDQYAPAPLCDMPTAVDYPRGAALMLRSFFLRAMRQIDERYGQFGSDADLAQQVRRSSKVILLVPAAHVRHHGREQTSSLRRADFLLGRATWIGKYQGLAAGMSTRIGSTLRLLVTFRLGEFSHAAGGQKIDGTQPS